MQFRAWSLRAHRDVGTPVTGLGHIALETLFWGSCGSATSLGDMS